MLRALSATLALALGWFASPSLAQSPVPEHDPHTLIVKFAPSVNGKALAKSLGKARAGVPSTMAGLAQAGVEALRPLFPIPPKGLADQERYDSLGLGQHYVFTLADSKNATDVATALIVEPSIEVVELNYLARLLESHLTPNDPSYGLQWHYGAIDLPAAWGITTGSGNVTVAVLDDGFQLDHPDLSGVFRLNLAEYNGFVGIDDDLNGYIDDALGWDFGDDDNNPYAGFNDTHGTHVAGTVGAFSNNSLGVSGVDWNCLILPVRVFNSASGGAAYSDVADGIYYAKIMGARVINLSLGGYAFSQLQDDLLHYAYLSGVLCVAAAGNADSAQVMHPAASDWAMAVGATDLFDQRWRDDDTHGSNFGLQLDVIAPGHLVYSTYPTWYANSPSYGFSVGTSMASPHVAGLASLILSVRPSLPPDSLYLYIAAGAEDQRGLSSEDTPGWDPYHGYGRINAYNSIRLALGQCVCKCFGDPQCDGVISDVLDVVAIVNVAFRGSTVITDFGCSAQRADVNDDGASDVLDVVAVVNVAFRGFSKTTVYHDPCN